MIKKINKILVIATLIVLQTFSLFVSVSQDKLYWFNYKEKHYIKIKHIIMEERTANIFDKYYLDVNNDGKITSLDYVMIRNRLEGVNP